MAITSARVTVSTTPVALNSASGAGERILIANGAQPIDLGPSTVAAGAGYSVAASAVVGPLDLDPNDQLFAVRSGGTDSVVSVLRL
jgi:hypothetical protein